MSMELNFDQVCQLMQKMKELGVEKIVIGDVQLIRSGLINDSAPKASLAPGQVPATREEEDLAYISV